MRILHLTVERSFPGLLRQLECEVRSSEKITAVEWQTLAFFEQSYGLPFVRRLPWGLRGAISRKLYAWLWLLFHSKGYDFVLVRHMPFDPFAFFFSPWIKNRISVHHSKEFEELLSVRQGWKGKLASHFERVMGGFVRKRSIGILGVTDEIRVFQIDMYRLGLNIPSSVYPNGICFDTSNLLEDLREQKGVEIIFACSVFSEWQGLDILFEQSKTYDSELMTSNKSVTLHIVGKLMTRDSREIMYLNKTLQAIKFKVYGVISAEDCRKVMRRCHIGLDSLAVFRKRLKQASSLKSRDMLAMGLPVFSGHSDGEFPPSFPYYRTSEVRMSLMVQFAEEMALLPRSYVREQSRPYVEKHNGLTRVVSFLQSVSKS